MFYVGQTCKCAFERFQEHIREAKRLFKLASSSFDFNPLYATIAQKGFHSFRVFPIEKVEALQQIVVPTTMHSTYFQVD
jgi:hypothetical protein